MIRVLRPRPSFLDRQKKHHVANGKQVWVSANGTRYYTWDELHGEIEVFNRRGKHIAVLDPDGKLTQKEPVSGRCIDV